MQFVTVDSKGHIINMIQADECPDGHILMTDEAQAMVYPMYRNDAWVEVATKEQINYKKSYVIKQQLGELDVFIPRGLEDDWASRVDFDPTKLPQIQRDRLKQKIDLRQQLLLLTET